MKMVPNREEMYPDKIGSENREGEWVSEWVNANRVIASHSIALQNVHSAIIQLICNSIKFCVIFRTECLSIFKIESECDMVVTESTAVYWENEHERCGSKSKTGSWRSFEMRIGKNERKRLLTYFNLMEPILNGEHFYTAQSTTINENPTTALISSIKKMRRAQKAIFNVYSLWFFFFFVFISLFTVRHSSHHRLFQRPVSKKRLKTRFHSFFLINLMFCIFYLFELELRSREKCAYSQIVSHYLDMRSFCFSLNYRQYSILSWASHRFVITTAEPLPVQ